MFAAAAGGSSSALIRARAGSRPDPHPHPARLKDIAVQREHPSQLAVDPQQDVHVLFGGVGIERRHDAALPEADHPDDRAPDVKLAALPPALGQSRNAGDEQVRAKPPPIVAERRDRTVRRDEQGQHVEPIQAVVAQQSGSGPGGLLHIARDVGHAPAPAVDQGLTVRAQRRVVQQKLRARPRRDDAPALILDVNDTISGDALGADLGLLQLLPGHGLDRIAPDLRQPHAARLMPR